MAELSILTLSGVVTGAIIKAAFKFGQMLGVYVKGWVRCQTKFKGLPEFRINIERNSWGDSFGARDAAGILMNSSC